MIPSRLGAINFSPASTFFRVGPSWAPYTANHYRIARNWKKVSGPSVAWRSGWLIDKDGDLQPLPPVKWEDLTNAHELLPAGTKAMLTIFSEENPAGAHDGSSAPLGPTQTPRAASETAGSGLMEERAPPAAERLPVLTKQDMKDDPDAACCESDTGEGRRPNR